MEGETDEQGESHHSGTTPALVDTLPHTCSSESNGLQNPEDPEEKEDVQVVLQEDVQEDVQAECNGQDATSQETLAAAKAQDNAQDPPLVPCQVPNTPEVSAEPCWYCLRSLDSQYRPKAPRQQPEDCEDETTLRWCCVQENPDPLSTLPPGGQKVSYQTDPRPHFGVAWSSHSPCRPLWGSEGPCWALRDEEVPDQTHSCPHCHLGLSPDTLRWHEAKCLVFEGRNSKK